MRRSIATTQVVVATSVDDGWGLQAEVRIGESFLVIPQAPIEAGLTLLTNRTSVRQVQHALEPVNRHLRALYGLPSMRLAGAAWVTTLAGALLPLLDEPLTLGEVAPPDEAVPAPLRWILTSPDVRTAATRLVGRKPTRPTVRALAEVLLGARDGSPSDLIPVGLAWVGSRLGLGADQIVSVLRANPDGIRLRRTLTTREIVNLMVLLDGMPPKQLTRVLTNTLQDAANEEELLTASDLITSVRPPDWSISAPGTTAGVLERANARWLERHGTSPLPQLTEPIPLGDGLTLRWHDSPNSLAGTGRSLHNCLAVRTGQYARRPQFATALSNETMAPWWPPSLWTVDRAPSWTSRDHATKLFRTSSGRTPSPR